MHPPFQEQSRIRTAKKKSDKNHDLLHKNNIHIELSEQILGMNKGEGLKALNVYFNDGVRELTTVSPTRQHIHQVIHIDSLDQILVSWVFTEHCILVVEQ